MPPLRRGGYHPSVMNVPLIVLVALVAVGFLSIVLEFFVPGMVLGALGGFFMLCAVVAGFIDKNPTTGVLTLGVAAVSTAMAIFLGMRILPETPVTLKHTQGQDEGFVAGPEGLPALAGKRGTSLTVLKPGGFAQIEGRKVSVFTEGNMIEEGVEIEVLRVDGGKVVVRALRA